MNSKVNVKRGSDINDYEEDILHSQDNDIAEGDDKVTTMFGVVEQFTASDIKFMTMPPYNIQRIPDRKDLEMHNCFIRIQKYCTK
jgi:hypothetical protein